jgi:hypothetical protein
MAQCEVCGNEYDKVFWMRRNMAWNALWRRNYRTSGSALLLTIKRPLAVRALLLTARTYTAPCTISSPV